MSIKDAVKWAFEHIEEEGPEIVCLEIFILLLLVALLVAVVVEVVTEPLRAAAVLVGCCALVWVVRQLREWSGAA